LARPAARVQQLVAAALGGEEQKHCGSLADGALRAAPFGNAECADRLRRQRQVCGDAEQGSRGANFEEGGVERLVAVRRLDKYLGFTLTPRARFQLTDAFRPGAGLAR